MKKYQKYDIFLIDADNTLFDYDMAEANALKIMFDKCGFEYTENIRQKYREINSQVWDSFEKGKISKEELQTSRFVRLFDFVGVCCDAKDFNEKYLYELGKGGFLIDGALEICEQIISHDKKIYIVTNGILATQMSRIKHSLIKDYIADFFVSESIGHQKPHISYFEYVFSHIPKIGKDKILIIGDSLTADIQGGCNAGIDSCWFNEAGANNNTTSIIPTYEIHHLSEIQKFI
jgi:2-haloacid dehalogenase